MQSDDNLETFHKVQLFYEKSRDYHQTASKLEQLALAMYVEDGQLARHLKRLRKHYRNKSTHLLQKLRTTFPQHKFELYETSLKITMAIKADLVDQYIALAKQNDILVNKNSNNQITLSFSGILDQDIDEAVDRLKEIWIN